MGRARRRLILLAAAAALALCLAPQAADATFPGSNDKLAYARISCGSEGCSSDIFTIEPGGANESKLTSFGDALYPSWSPNGQKIAFSHADGIWVINFDGTGLEQVLDWGLGVGRVTWSPDAAKLAAALLVCEADECRYDIHVLDADGSNATNLTPDLLEQRNPNWSPDGSVIAFDTITDGTRQIRTIAPGGGAETVLTAQQDSWPSWAPDSSRIAFESSREGFGQIYTMTAAGGNQTRITTPSPGHFSNEPAWSPNGLQVAFHGNRDVGCCDLIRRNLSGGGEAVVTHGSFAGLDWQSGDDPPVPPPVVGGYARPKGATPVVAYFVPAYAPCATEGANMIHGPPLVFGSCTPPAQISTELTVGTPDANGKPARGSAAMKLFVIPGDPGTDADEADLGVQLGMSHVYRRGDMGDYAGELELRLDVRITDRNNFPVVDNNSGGTMEDTTIDVPVQCAPTADPDLGGLCTVDTTLESLVPGLATEGSRGIWELGPMEVYDGGPDGVASTEPNELFQVQGLFVP